MPFLQLPCVVTHCIMLCLQTLLVAHTHGQLRHLLLEWSAMRRKAQGHQPDRRQWVTLLGAFRIQR